jgi:quinol monooxygenase YgiN
MFVVTVKFIINTTFKAQFIEAVQKQAKDSLDLESECHHFDVCTSQEKPNEVFLYEIYETVKSFDDHLITSHFQNFSQTISDWVELKTVETFNLIPR